MPSTWKMCTASEFFILAKLVWWSLNVSENIFLARERQPLSMCGRPNHCPFFLAKITLWFVSVVNTWSQSIKHGGPMPATVILSNCHLPVTELAVSCSSQWNLRGTLLKDFWERLSSQIRERSIQEGPFLPATSFPALVTVMWVMILETNAVILRLWELHKC